MVCISVMLIVLQSFFIYFHSLLSGDTQVFAVLLAYGKLLSIFAAARIVQRSYSKMVRVSLSARMPPADVPVRVRNVVVAVHTTQATVARTVVQVRKRLPLAQPIRRTTLTPFYWGDTPQTPRLAQAESRPPKVQYADETAEGPSTQLRPPEPEP